MTKHTSESFRGKWHNAEPSWTTSAAMLPSLANGALKIVLGITVGLYVLNQQHMLPRGLSSIVSKALFWPTLPITAVKRIGAWYTTIDDTVILGGAPFGFLKIPEELYREYGVRRNKNCIAG